MEKQEENMPGIETNDWVFHLESRILGQVIDSQEVTLPDGKNTKAFEVEIQEHVPHQVWLEKEVCFWKKPKHLSDQARRMLKEKEAELRAQQNPKANELP